MMIITLWLLAVLATLFVRNVLNIAKSGITTFIKNLTSECLVFDLEYTLKIFFSFLNLPTVLTLPDFSDLKVILLLHPSINAQVCLECLKLLQSLHFIDNYKKKK